MLFMSWVILSGPGRPLVQLTPSNQSAPGGRCIPCEPGGPCLPSPISTYRILLNLQSLQMDLFYIHISYHL
jgi:hypothetical protein